jgi:hypothetical protein
MAAVFNPFSGLNNARQYANAGFKNAPVILPCIVTRVYNNLRVDIYIPYTSTLMESLPLVFDSFSEEQGSIITPEENSLALFIGTSDGRRLVYGGLSLSENYTVRNILPGELEQYVKNASYKQDLAGNHVFLSKLCSTEIFGEDGVKQSYINGYYCDNGQVEEFSDFVQINNEKRRPIYIKKFYNVNDVNIPANEELILQKNQEMQDKICEYLVSIQNLRENYSDDAMVELREKIHKNYRKLRKLYMKIEEGCAANKKIRDRIDISKLSEKDLAHSAGGSLIIYRIQVFDSDENLNFSFSISENGQTEIWEKKEEIVINHGLNDNPTITLLQADSNEANLRLINCEVVYLTKNSVRLSLNRKYGVVETVDNQGAGRFEIKMKNRSKLLLKLGYSAEKMEEMIKQFTQKQ